MPRIAGWVLRSGRSTRSITVSSKVEESLGNSQGRPLTFGKAIPPEGLVSSGGCVERLQHWPLSSISFESTSRTHNSLPSIMVFFLQNLCAYSIEALSTICRKLHAPLSATN